MHSLCNQHYRLATSCLHSTSSSLSAHSPLRDEPDGLSGSLDELSTCQLGHGWWSGETVRLAVCELELGECSSSAVVHLRYVIRSHSNWQSGNNAVLGILPAWRLRLTFSALRRLSTDLQKSTGALEQVLHLAVWVNTTTLQAIQIG